MLRRQEPLWAGASLVGLLLLAFLLGVAFRPCLRCVYIGFLACYRFLRPAFAVIFFVLAGCAWVVKARARRAYYFCVFIFAAGAVIFVGAASHCGAPAYLQAKALVACFQAPGRIGLASASRGFQAKPVEGKAAEDGHAEGGDLRACPSRGGSLLSEAWRILARVSSTISTTWLPSTIGQVSTVTFEASSPPRSACPRRSVTLSSSIEQFGKPRSARLPFRVPRRRILGCLSPLFSRVESRSSGEFVFCAAVCLLIHLVRLAPLPLLEGWDGHGGGRAASSCGSRQSGR